MTTTDHLTKAKEYIAIAESGDATLDAYRRAADEIIAAREGDHQLSYAAIARRLGKNKRGQGRNAEFPRRLVQWRTNATDPRQLPFGGEVENEARYERQTKTTLKDPERRKAALTSLSMDELDEVQRDATEALVQRSRAERSEHRTEPTIRELTGGEKFDPAETWADAHITRAWSAAHDLRRHIEKYGLVVGSMSDEQAMENIARAEADIAEVRAAIQERIRDEAVA